MEFKLIRYYLYYLITESRLNIKDLHQFSKVFKVVGVTILIWAQLYTSNESSCIELFVIKIRSPLGVGIYNRHTVFTKQCIAIIVQLDKFNKNILTF